MRLITEFIKKVQLVIRVEITLHHTMSGECTATVVYSDEGEVIKDGGQEMVCVEGGERKPTSIHLWYSVPKI